MSEKYRKKLLYWLISMGTLMLMVVIFALFHWARALGSTIRSDGEMYWLYGLDNALSFYAIGFVPLFIWHAFDFIQIEKPICRIGILLDRYRNIFICLVVLGASVWLYQIPWLDDLFCSNPDLPEGVFQFDGCGSWTPAWKAFSIFAALTFLLVFVVAKGVISVLSRLRNAA